MKLKDSSLKKINKSSQYLATYQHRESESEGNKGEINIRNKRGDINTYPTGI